MKGKGSHPELYLFQPLLWFPTLARARHDSKTPFLLLYCFTAIEDGANIQFGLDKLIHISESNFGY